MAVLSFDQIRDLWIRNGGNPAMAYTAAAVAMAESGGRTDAVGDVNLKVQGEKSVGLWQMNYRPMRDVNNPIRDPNKNLDADYNARSAIALSRNGTNWGGWTTYTNGAYKKFLAANPPKGILPLDTGNILANLQPSGTTVNSGVSDVSRTSGHHDDDPVWSIDIPGPFNINSMTRSQARGMIAVLIGIAAVPVVFVGAVITSGGSTNIAGGALGGAVAGSPAGPVGALAGAAGGAANGAIPRTKRAGQGRQAVERGVADRRASEKERRQAEDRMARDELAARRRRAESPEGKSRAARAEGKRNAKAAGPFPYDEEESA